MNQPKEIWLQPWCDECHGAALQQHGGGGRQWCEDDVWSSGCDDCDEKSVRYVLAKGETQ